MMFYSMLKFEELCQGWGEIKGRSQESICLKSVGRKGGYWA